MVRKSLRVTYMIAFICLLSSCMAFHKGYMVNSASLNQANFKYVREDLQGSATATYFLIWGGWNHDNLIQEAKENMLMNYTLEDNQAIVNLTVGWEKRITLFTITHKCVVTADIVEFQ